MSLQVPTIEEIRVTIQSQLETQVTGMAPILPKAFVRVLSQVLAAVFVILYKYASFMFLQMFVTTATYEWTTIGTRRLRPLVEWGRLFGVGEPGVATPWDGTIRQGYPATGLGFVVKAGTQLLNAGNGLVYLVSTDTTLVLTGGEYWTPIPVVCATSGVDGNLGVGDTLDHSSPNASYYTETTIETVGADGEDAETEDSYRQRVLDISQKRPQGGSYVDYEIWAEEAAGVAAAYPYTGLPGQMNVYIESATELPSRVPTPTQLAAAKQSILYDDLGLLTRAPAGVLVETLPISNNVYFVEISGITLGDISQGDFESLMTKQLAAYFEGRRPYIEGTTVLPRKDRMSVSSIGGLASDVADAYNSAFVGITFYDVTAPTTNLFLETLGEGELALQSHIDFDSV